MGKRQQSDLNGIEGLGDVSSKRPHQGEVASEFHALIDLSTHADDLIENLQSLKRWAQDVDNTIQKTHVDTETQFPRRDQLSLLSRKVLPLLRTIAHPDVEFSDQGGPPAKRMRSHESADTLPVPAVAVGPWKASEIPKELPPLPPVRDEDVEAEAFRHPGMVSVTGGRSYERLEWLGDAYLELIATIIIDRTFSDLPSGRCSQLREQLVRNITLADYFRRYDLNKKATLPPEMFKVGPGRGRSADKDLTKTQGDMFEAYVAAVIVSDPKEGLANCANWLKALWSTTIPDRIIQVQRGLPRSEGYHSKAPGGELRLPEGRPRVEQRNPNVEAGDSKPSVTNAQEGTVKHRTPKEELATLVVVKGVKVEYKDKPGKEKKDRNMNLPLFTIGAYLTGWGEQDKLLGWGSSINKKEAGHLAAKMAIDNRKMLKVYQQKKAAYMEAEAARLAAQGVDSQGNELGQS